MGFSTGSRSAICSATLSTGMTALGFGVNQRVAPKSNAASGRTSQQFSNSQSTVSERTDARIHGSTPTTLL